MMQQLTRFALFCAVPATLAAVALPTTASAAVIDAASAARLQDGAGDNPIDDIGDSATASSPDSGAAAWIGWHGQGDRFKYGYVFDLSGYEGDVLNAQSIVFSVNVIEFPHSSADIDYDVQLIAMSEDETGTLVATDYHREGALAATFTAPEAGDTLVADVTEWVQADALAGNYTSFRLQLANPPASDGTHTGYYFEKGVATLTTTPIPEPASLALLGLGAVIGLRRRSR